MMAERQPLESPRKVIVDRGRSPWGLFYCEEMTDDDGQVRHTFSLDTEATTESATLVIARPHSKQALRFGDFGRRLAPSGEVLAWLVAKGMWNLRSKRVLELGAGLGLPGMAAAAWADCSFVCISDGDAELVQVLRTNIANNAILGAFKGDVREALIEWREKYLMEDYAADEGLFDIILCADCVYDTQMHTPLLMTLRRFLKPSGKAIIMASPRNGSLSEFLKAAHAYFRCDLCVEYDEAVSNRKVEGVPFRQHKCFPHLVTLDMMDMDGHGKDYSILEDGMSKRFVERQQRKLKEAELAESLQSRYLGKRESRRLILTDDELKSSVDRMINPVSSKKKRLEPPYQLAKASASATGRPGTRIQRLGVEMPIAYHPWRERDPLTVRMIRESVELALGSALHADQTTPSGGDNDQVNAEDWTAHVNDMRRPLSADLQGLRAPLVVSERIQRLSQPRPHTPVALRMMPAPAAATKATFASATAEGHCKQAAQNDSGDAEDKMRVLYEQPIPKTPQWRGAPSQARAVSLPHATQHRGELSAAELALASRLFPEHGGEVRNVSSGLHQASRRKLPVAQSRPLSALNSNPWNGISARPSSPPPTVQPASGEGSSLLQDRLDSLQQELRNTSAPKTGGAQAVYKDGMQLLVPLRGELEATPGLPLAGQAGGALTFYPHLQQPLTRATVQRGGACGGRDRAAFDARSMEAVRAALTALRGGDPERKTPRSCRRPVLHLEHRAHACRSRSSFVPARHTHGRLRQVGPSGRAGTSLALGPG